LPNQFRWVFYSASDELNASFFATKKLQQKSRDLIGDCSPNGAVVAARKEPLVRRQKIEVARVFRIATVEGNVVF